MISLRHLGCVCQNVITHVNQKYTQEKQELKPTTPARARTNCNSASCNKWLLSKEGRSLCQKAGEVCVRGKAGRQCSRWVSWLSCTLCLLTTLKMACWSQASCPCKSTSTDLFSRGQTPVLRTSNNFQDLNLGACFACWTHS